MKKVLIFLFPLTFIFFVSCFGGKGDSYYKSMNYLKEMKSYVADAEITVNRSKGTSTYQVKQYFKAPDKVRIEVLSPDFIKGKISVFTNGEGYEYNPLIGQKIKIMINSIEDYINLGVIQTSLLTGEEVEYTKEGSMIKIKAPIPEGDKYTRYVVLYLDGSKYYPKYMELHDENGMVRVKINYSNFKYNYEVNDEIFILE